MKRSVGWFLFFFVIVVATGAALIWLTPAVIDSNAETPAWLLALLAAIFVAAAFVAWKLRPNGKETPSTHP